MTSVQTWHPEFLQTLDSAITRLDTARKEYPLERTHALEAVRKAEDDLQYILVEWEGIPEPAADIIRGVLFEVRAVQQAIEDTQQGKGVAKPDTITGRLLDAIKGLEALDDNR